MKKIWKLWLLIFVLAFGFNGEMSPEGTVLQAQAATKTTTKVKLSYSRRKEFKLASNQIRQGDTGKVKIVGKKVSNVKWKSSKKSVLTVDQDGVIKAKRAGKSTVTATFTYKKKTIERTLEIQVVSRWKAEQKKFPTGSYWNEGDDDKVTYQACVRHANGWGPGQWTCTSNAVTYLIDGVNWTGYQCHGFALKVAADIYGSSKLANWDKRYTYRSPKVGDVIRIWGDTHTIIVTKVYSKSIEYADCNATGLCRIQWGQRMSKKDLKSNFTYMFTRR